MKVLFIAPHLSTGGMPAFLLKRIQALKQYTDIEVFVIEWKCYSTSYTVQRDQIQNLLGNNFTSYWGEINKQKTIVDFCYQNQIDIIHIEEIPEGFDSHNPFPFNLQKELYSDKHPWRVVETCHNIYFKPEEGKVNHPNGYACVTPYHINDTFANSPGLKSFIPFPIDPSIVSPLSKEEILNQDGWRLKGEFHIINVGLWTPGKNQKYMVEIAKKLYKKYGFTYIFHFIGNQAPNFKNYWEPIMQELSPNIMIYGEKSNTDRYFKMADLMLFTSTWECNPIVLKEAISNNLKIMAFNLDHYGDEYQNYITPLTGNIDIDSNNLINNIHTQNKYSIENSSNIKEFANKHLTFYQKLINEKT